MRTKYQDLIEQTFEWPQQEFSTEDSELLWHDIPVMEIIKQYGTQEWDKLIQIKTEIEKLEKADKDYFDAELSKVRQVQFWCFMAAAWIAYYIVWGSKR